MNGLQVIGTQEFMGKEIPVIAGGFGEDCKVILAKTIAEIHGVELKEINRIINNNIDEFEEGIDILDLKGNKNFEVIANHHGIMNQNAVNRSSNIYLLSEQGYMLLVGFMKSDKAKEIRKELRRGYFAMREVIRRNELSLEQELALKVFEGGMTAIEANKILNKVHYDKGYGLGLDKGIAIGREEKEQELIDELNRRKNGNNVLLNLGQCASMLYNAWSNELNQNGIYKLDSGNINGYLVSRGLLIKEYLPKLYKGEYIYDINGNKKYENSPHYKITDDFKEFISQEGYSFTGKTNDGRKDKIQYNVYFLERFINQHKESFLSYMVNK